MCLETYWSFPDSSVGKESARNAGDLGSILGREDPLERERLPSPVFWPGESYGHTVHGVTKTQTWLGNFNLLRNLLWNILDENDMMTEIFFKIVLRLLVFVDQSLSHVWFFCNPLNCSLPGSSVHGIFQTKILEWVAISFFRGSSQFRDWSPVSCIGRWILYCLATREALGLTESENDSCSVMSNSLRPQRL